MYSDGIVGHGHFGIEFLDIAQHRGCARFKVVTVDLTAQSAVVQLILISCDGASGTYASTKVNLGHNVCLAVHLGNLRGASLHAYPKVAVVGLGYSRNPLSHVNGLANGGLSLFQYEQLAACNSEHLSIGYGHGQLACPLGTFDEGFSACLAVKEVHAVVIADKDVFLIKHGDMCGPVQGREFFIESGFLDQGLAIGHHEHAVIIEPGSYGIGLSVLRDDVHLFVEDVDVLRHVAQLRTVHGTVGVVQYFAFLVNVDERSVFGGHVSFVEDEHTCRVGKSASFHADACDGQVYEAVFIGTLETQFT